MAYQRNLIIGAALVVILGITLTMLGMLRATSAVDLPMDSYALLAGACACLVAAAMIGFRMVRRAPEGRSKDERF